MLSVGPLLRRNLLYQKDKQARPALLATRLGRPQTRADRVPSVGRNIDRPHATHNSKNRRINKAELTLVDALRSTDLGGDSLQARLPLDLRAYISLGLI